jgi:hypothetical protein
MKSLLTKLRLLIAAGSLAGFLGGWVLLAHGPKPVESGAAAANPPAAQVPGPLPTLDIQSLAPDGDVPSGLQPLPALPPQSAMPRLRTSGS